MGSRFDTACDLFPSQDSSQPKSTPDRLLLARMGTKHSDANKLRMFSGSHLLAPPKSCFGWPLEPTALCPIRKNASASAFACLPPQAMAAQWIDCVGHIKKGAIPCAS